MPQSFFIQSSKFLGVWQIKTLLGKYGVSSFERVFLRCASIIMDGDARDETLLTKSHNNKNNNKSKDNDHNHGQSSLN